LLQYLNLNFKFKMLIFFTIIYFIIASLFVGLLLKRICHVKQEVFDTGEGSSIDGKMPYVVDK